MILICHREMHSSSQFAHHVAQDDGHTKPSEETDSRVQMPEHT